MNIKLDYNTLMNVLHNEVNRSGLSRLNDDFFINANMYIEEIISENPDDLRTYTNAKTCLNRIINLRISKISQSLIYKLAEHMYDEEEYTHDELPPNILKNEERLYMKLVEDYLNCINEYFGEDL